MSGDDIDEELSDARRRPPILGLMLLLALVFWAAVIFGVLKWLRVV